MYVYDCIIMSNPSLYIYVSYPCFSGVSCKYPWLQIYHEADKENGALISAVPFSLPALLAHNLWFHGQTSVKSKNNYLPVGEGASRLEEGGGYIPSHLIFFNLVKFSTMWVNYMYTVKCPTRQDCTEQHFPHFLYEEVSI